MAGMSHFWLILALVAPLTGQTPLSLKVFGAVPTPLTLTAQDLASMPRVKVTDTAHGQGGVYEGVAMRDVLTKVGVPAGTAIRGAEVAKTVIVTGADGYQAAFAMSAAAIVAAAFTGRMVFYRSAAAPAVEEELTTVT